MLILRRKKNEWVDIGNNISVCVVEIADDYVRLGFAAPRDVPVHRRELTTEQRAELFKKNDGTSGEQN